MNENKMRDALDFVREFCLDVLLPLALIAVPFLVLLVVLAEGFGRYQCANYERFTGMETRRTTFDTCYVHTDEGWQRWDEYIMRSVASDGLKGEK